MDISILERFGAEPVPCEECFVPPPHHADTCPLLTRARLAPAPTNVRPCCVMARHYPSERCVLPHGHAGVHQGQGGGTWDDNDAVVPLSHRQAEERDVQLAHDEIDRSHASEVRLLRERQAAERERDEARQAADQWATAARDAQRAATLRGLLSARAAFEAWRDGDKGLVGCDDDIYLAAQTTLHGFDRLVEILRR